MLTQKPAAEAAPRAAGAPLDLASLTCLFEGRYVPLGEANVSIMTHAFLYGTAVFEGIRAYWNEEQGQLYALKVREHMARIRSSARILLMEDLPVGRPADRRGARGPAPERLPRGRLRAALVLQEHPGDRRQAPRARAPLLHPGAALRRLRRHDGRREGRRRSPGAAPSDPAIPSRAKIDGALRQPGLQQDGGDAQRLRRGPRPDRTTATSRRARPRTSSWSATASCSRRR